MSVLGSIQRDSTQDRWNCIRNQAKYCRSIVDEKTGKKWCDFTATKKEMPEQMCKWLNSMKARGFKVKVMRLDPTGENVALEKQVETVE